MEVIKEVMGTELTLKISGRIDTSTSVRLRKEVKDSTPGMTSLVFDLSGVNYLSSAGLRVFVEASDIMKSQGAMKIVGANKDLMEIFKVIGFLEIMDIQ